MLGIKIKCLQYLPGWIKKIITKFFTETLQGPLLSLLNTNKNKILQIFDDANFPFGQYPDPANQNFILIWIRCVVRRESPKQGHLTLAIIFWHCLHGVITSGIPARTHVLNNTCTCLHVCVLSVTMCDMHVHQVSFLTVFSFTYLLKQT